MSTRALTAEMSRLEGCTCVVVEIFCLLEGQKIQRWNDLNRRDSFRTSTSERAWCGASPQAIAETYDMGLYRDAFRGYRRVCRNDSDVVTNG
jgi:hypothetical protein